MYDIYVEECEKEPEATEELRSNVNLLEKLVARESWPCLVVNLYPGKGGYSLMLKGENGSCSETIRMPYEDGEMLDYLDAEELPPVLVDLLEKSEVDVFHRGCVIAEVRDYRQCSNAAPPGYQSRHVLLRPTMQTLAADVQAIARDGQNWTQEDKLLLESQLILATAEPLCLEPSVAVACAENRLLYNRQKMNARPVKQSFKRYSLPALNREETLPHRPLPPQLRARARRGKATDGDAVGPHDLKISKAGNCVDMWKQRPCELAVPSEVDVGRYAKGKASAWRADPPPPGAWPVGKVREDSPLLRGEARGAAQTAAPTVGQWVNDPATSAKRSREEARCERQMSLPDHPSTEDPSSSSLPASETEAGRGSGRSEELVRERATCPVKMSWSPAGSASLSQLAPGKETQQPDMALVQSPVLGKGVKYLPSPTQLLPSSGKSSSGNFFVPEQASSILKSLASTPAPKPQSVSQRFSMEVNQVNKTPAATSFTVNSSEGVTILSTVNSAQRMPATPVMANSTDLDILHVLGPVLNVQSLASGTNPVQGSTPGVIAPEGTEPSNQPSGGQTPSVQPVALQEPSQVGVQLFLENAPNLRPVTLLHLSKGSLVLKTEQLSQQQQWLYQLIPPPGQQLSTLCPQQGPSAPESSSFQQAVVINLSGMGSLQCQPSVWCNPGCGESTPGSDLPQDTPAVLCLEEVPALATTCSADTAVEDPAAASGRGSNSSPRSSATADSKPVHRPPAPPPLYVDVHRSCLERVASCTQLFEVCPRRDGRQALFLRHDRAPPRRRRRRRRRRRLRPRRLRPFPAACLWAAPHMAGIVLLDTAFHVGVPVPFPLRRRKGHLVRPCRRTRTQTAARLWLRVRVLPSLPSLPRL
ncbi:Transcription factor SPT20 [Galemys pyrenaicus]|uniref:Transcription factor SPT20 n=1 Tax=Galemys pyrenaicus TaxID=202257 RepID=A0A8J6DP86_GALPY|nr:Transcription factor SPT20 [Galemys pyrenaicus]